MKCKTLPAEHWARHEFERKDPEARSMCGLKNVSMVFMGEDGEATCRNCLRVWTQAQHDRDLEELSATVDFPAEEIVIDG